MFSPFPQFEECAIYLSIDWGGRRRPILVRLEQWPQSRHAVLVCRFEDEPEYGEWVVMTGNLIPHFVGNPGKILRNQVIWNVATRRPFATTAFSDFRLERLKSIVQRAFKGDNFQIGRVLQLPNWPSEPRLLLWCPGGASWCGDWALQVIVRFDWLPSPLHLSDQQMLDMIDAKWNEPESDMRFAWQWTNLSEADRLQGITGYTNNFSELEQVMKWIMVCTSRLWETGMGWTWALRSPDVQEKDTDSYWIWNHSDYFSEQDEHLMEKWSQFLLSIFVPCWRNDWFNTHQCVRDFWGYRSLGEAAVSASPTMHERLEARFALRDWLDDKATPDEIHKLMSCYYKSGLNPDLAIDVKVVFHERILRNQFRDY